MAQPLHCRFCNKLLTEKTARGCPSCGAYVCDLCWGPGGDVCVNCSETHEDGNYESDNWEEDEEEADDDC